MGHLVDDLGSSYITDFFNGAYFMHQDALFRFSEIARDGVSIRALKVIVPDLKSHELTELATLDVRILEKFDKFSWPKLGYRNQMDSDGVLYATNVQSVRSTRRGLSEDLLNITYDPATSVAISAGGFDKDRTYTMYQVFFPKWYTYREALALLKSQEAVSVALNEDVCISHCVNPQHPNATYEIYFRGKSVGAISKSGGITFTNKLVNKMKMFNKLLHGM